MKQILIIIITLIIVQLNAQNITNYNTNDGLIGNMINCVAIAEGTNDVWVATNSGVSKFNGSTWVNYTTTDGIVDNDVKTITEASGNIWIGTDFGVSKFDGTNWTTYTTSDGLALDKVAHIAQSPTGDLWFSHSSFSAGVSVLESGGSWNIYSYPDLPMSGVCAVSFDNTPNGGVWLASPLDGVLHFDYNTFTQYTSNSHGLINNFSSSILVDNPYTLVGTNGGMSVINFINDTVANYTQMYLLPPPDTLNEVQAITQDSHGGIWVAIYVGYLNVGGVAYNNGSQWVNFDVADGLAGPYVRSIVADEQDNIWVGTSTGLSKISGIFSSSGELEIHDRVNIFPNPTNGVLSFRANKSIHSIRISDLFGRTVLNSFAVSASNITIDISTLSRGIYISEIKTLEGTYKEKIILK